MTLSGATQEPPPLAPTKGRRKACPLFKGAKGGKAPPLALPPAQALALANTPWPHPSPALKKEKR